MIGDGGYAEHSIWEHSATVRELYARRCRLEAEEMTCAAQAAELLAPHVQPGDTLLDAGCGSGYFFHSLRARSIPVEYHGVDASPTLIEIGRVNLAPHGLDPRNLHVLRLEDLAASVDHVVCMNVLSNIDNYHRPLERLLESARKTVILRESVKDGSEYRYVRDDFLDEGVDLRVHVNAYDRADWNAFIEARGFDVREVVDRRSGGKPELVVGYPHWWSFFVATRRSSGLV